MPIVKFSDGTLKFESPNGDSISYDPHEDEWTWPASFRRARGVVELMFKELAEKEITQCKD